VTGNTTTGNLIVTGTIVSNVAGVGQFSSESTMGFKNRIINGGMTIAQRATSVTGADAYCCVDRFDYSRSTIVWNAAQSTDVPSTTNFRYSTSVTVTTASSAAGAYAYLYHAVEGYNWADLGYGTASTQTSTLSFWVKSSLTGTFGIALRNTGTARFYTTTYTINSANTWEQKTITITGDTSGTWNTTNSAGIQLFWDLGVGSTYSSTSNNAWSTVASNYFGVTGVTKLGATNGATFFITGVQLEKGSTATSFDYRPYGTEFQLCQRYYEQSNLANGNYLGIGMVWTATDCRIVLQFQVPKRTSPTSTFSGTLTWGTSTITKTITSHLFDTPSTNSVLMYNQSQTGMTIGQAFQVQTPGASSATITFSAEL
jgi:hypothetical protein